MASTRKRLTAKERREVVHGPQTRILAFDEDLEVLELSTGKPKSQEATLRTCFLQTEGNTSLTLLPSVWRKHVRSVASCDFGFPVDNSSTSRSSSNARMRVCGPCTTSRRSFAVRRFLVDAIHLEGGRRERAPHDLDVCR